VLPVAESKPVIIDAPRQRRRPAIGDLAPQVLRGCASIGLAGKRRADAMDR